MHDVNGVESGGAGTEGVASGAADGTLVGAGGSTAGGSAPLGTGFGTGAWPLEARGSLRLFVWPRFDDPEHLERLVAALAPVLGDERVSLVVRHDARTDPERDVALDALLAAGVKSPAALRQAFESFRTLSS